MTVRCKSEAARRILLDHLAEHDPDMAEFFATVETALGPVAELRYSGATEAVVRERLEAMRAKGADLLKSEETSRAAHAARSLLAGAGPQPV